MSNTPVPDDSFRYRGYSMTGLDEMICFYQMNKGIYVELPLTNECQHPDLTEVRSSSPFHYIVSCQKCGKTLTIDQTKLLPMKIPDAQKIIFQRIGETFGEIWRKHLYSIYGIEDDK